MPHVTDAICENHTAVSVSRLSHDGLWDEVEMGADIPVATGAAIPGEVTSEDLDWAAGAVDAYRPAT